MSWTLGTPAKGVSDSRQANTPTKGGVDDTRHARTHAKGGVDDKWREYTPSTHRYPLHSGRHAVRLSRFDDPSLTHKGVEKNPQTGKSHRKAGQ